MISRRQLVAAGLTRQAIHRRVEAGWLVRLHKGVYAVGHTALSHHAHLIAAVYACGLGALASHRPAGGLWRLLRGGQPIEVTTRTPRASRAGIVLHRSRHIAEEDRAIVNGIPVTSLARTLLDLADVLTERR